MSYGRVISYNIIKICILPARFLFAPSLLFFEPAAVGEEEEWQSVPDWVAELLLLGSCDDVPGM